MPEPLPPGQYIQESANRDPVIAPSPTGVAAFVGAASSGPEQAAIRCASIQQFEQTFGPVGRSHPLSVGVSHFFANGGTSCWVVRVGGAGGRPTVADVVGERTGIHALDDVDAFDVLCIPDAVALAAAEMRAVYRAALRDVQRRRAFLLIDIPESVNTVQAMRTWLTEHQELRSPDAAVHFPRLVAPDATLAGGMGTVASSGALAGLYARIDATRGVWKAPAGVEADLKVHGLAAHLTDTDLGMLTELGVNGLRTLARSRHVAWGARTLDGAADRPPDWRYVPTRRLALFIARSLQSSLQWVVFEPNDEPLHIALVRITNAFLQTLFTQGAFAGSRPDQAFFVRCGPSTTTEADVARGVVNIVIGIATGRPAEFAVITVGVAAGMPSA